MVSVSPKQKQLMKNAPRLSFVWAYSVSTAACTMCGVKIFEASKKYFATLAAFTTFPPGSGLLAGGSSFEAVATELWLDSRLAAHRKTPGTST